MSANVTLIAGLAAISGAVILGVIAVLAGPAKSSSTQVSPAQQLGGPAPRALPDDTIEPLLTRLARFARRLTATGYTEKLQKRLDFAGNPPAWPAERVLAFKGVGLVFFALLGA